MVMAALLYLTSQALLANPAGCCGHAINGSGVCCADMIAMIGEYQQLSRDDTLHLVIECLASVVRAGRDACAAWAWPAARALLTAWVIDPTDQVSRSTPPRCGAPPSACRRARACADTQGDPDAFAPSPPPQLRG